jgi:hypothetical protein
MGLFDGYVDPEQFWDRAASLAQPVADYPAAALSAVSDANNLFKRTDDAMRRAVASAANLGRRLSGLKYPQGEGQLQFTARNRCENP